MVSIDGCRWDCLEDEELSNLRWMRENGASAEQMLVTIPSMTAPGHVTLITGAWAGTHGIVLNKFYDRKLGLVKFFGGIPTAAQTEYLLAEPVWATAKKAGLVTASVHWAATAGTYDGLSVDRALPFAGDWDDHKRIQEAVQVFVEERPHLLLVYTTGVSPATYKHGVGSPQVRDKLRQVDGWIGELREAIQSSDMADETDLVIVSDHGFGAALETELCISWLLDQAGIAYDFVLWGAIGHVFLKDPGKAGEVQAMIEQLEGVDRVLLGPQADELHLATKDRTGDVLVVCKQGCQVANMWRPCDAAIVKPQPDYELAGTHGYPPEDDPDMRGIFVAAGPHVRQTNLGKIQQIDVAPTLSALLGIDPPADADGKPLDLIEQAQ